MINFYGGQKGENYIISQIFANTEELKKDLALDENSPVGLNEIVMISYGEYTNDGTGAYWTNLEIDNPTFTGEEDYSNVKIYNSSLYQKVPNGNLAADDIVGEKVTYDENGQVNFVPINLYKYKFLTSSMGQTPRLILKTGEAVEAWETPLVTENETSQITQPIFNLSMPKAPTIIGSNGGEGKDIGILINPEAKELEDTDINPYQVIKFDIVSQGEADKLQSKILFTEEGFLYNEISYAQIQEKVMQVNYESNNNSEPQIIDINLRGPEGPPGRSPVVAGGKWYNWVLGDNNQLQLQDSDVSASFNIIKVIEFKGQSISGVLEDKKIFIERFVDSLVLTDFKYFTDIIVGNLQWNDETPFTIACYKLLDRETNTEKIGWSYMIANGSNFLIEPGTSSNSIQQYNNINTQSAKAIGEGAVAFGQLTEAAGKYSFAEGIGTSITEDAEAGHVEGKNNRVEGVAGHAEGIATIAKSEASHAQGEGTIATALAQHVQGRYNKEDINKEYAHIAGNGTSDANRSNAYTLDWDGNAWFQGSVISKTYQITLSANNWQTSQDDNGVNKYTQQIILTDFNSHGEDWSVIVNPVYTNNMTKLELQNYQREYNRLSSGYILTETTQNKKERINFTVFDRPPQKDLTIVIKVV